MCGGMPGVQTVANNRERPNERDSRIRVCRLLCVARTGQGVDPYQLETKAVLIHL